MSDDETQQCPTCGHIWPASAPPMCPNTPCPAHQRSAWESSLAQARALTADLDADDGSNADLGRRAFSLWRNLWPGGPSTGYHEAQDVFVAARGRWNERRVAILQRERDAQAAADAARLPEIRERFLASKLLTIDDVRFLLGQVCDEDEMSSDAIADGIEELLAANGRGDGEAE